MRSISEGKRTAACPDPPFASAKPMAPDSYPLWDPGSRMRSGLKPVTREEAGALSARSGEAAGMDMRLPDPIVSLIVVNPAPTDFHSDARPVKVPVTGYRGAVERRALHDCPGRRSGQGRGALAYFAEVGG
jgi:hypothetical protein